MHRSKMIFFKEFGFFSESDLMEKPGIELIGW